MLADNSYADYDVFSTNRLPTGCIRQKVKPLSGSSLSTTWVEDEASGSLEAIHGMYHGVIGVRGHMSRVPVAAFDPVFWMHHNQIERMFTIWQASHANEKKNWFTSDRDMAKDALYPFRKTRDDNNNTTFWSSNDCVTSDILGYTYEDAQGSSEQVRTRVGRLYEWSIPLTSMSKIRKPPAELAPVGVLQTQFFKKSTLLAATTAAVAVAPQIITEMVMKQNFMAPLAQQVELRAETQAPDANEKYSYEWFVDDEVQRLALNGALTIFYFINQKTGASAPAADHDLLLESSLAGLARVFAAPVEACDNCGQQGSQGQIVTNTNAITSMLLEYVKVRQLQSLTPEYVAPFLQDRLRWKIVGVDGNVQDARRMNAQKGFRVNVSLKKAEPPRGSGRATCEEFPQIIEEIVRRAS